MLLLGCGACSFWPSTWRLGGTPLEKVEKREAQKHEAADHVLGAAQRSAHQVQTVVEAARTEAPSQSLDVAVDLSAETVGLLDQALGSPPASDVAAWRDLAIRLIAKNARTREAAEAERTAQRGENDALARRLAAATAAAQRANSRALDYARDREELADFAAKLKLGFFAVLGLVALGTVLSVAARFFPAVGLASRVVNGVVAPGITFAAHRAEAGLKAVGKGMANLRQIAGNAEDLIERAFDGVTDADHQRLISAAAKSAAPAKT